MMALAELKTELERLGTVELEHLGHALLARAAVRRQRMTPEEARAALDEVELGIGSGSSFEHLLRARGAARRLVTMGWHPEQLAQPLADECASRCAQCQRLGLHVDAVAMGISDGLDGRGCLMRHDPTTEAVFAFVQAERVRRNDPPDAETPAPEPQSKEDGADLLDAVRAFIARFVALRLRWRARRPQQADSGRYSTEVQRVARIGRLG